MDINTHKITCVCVEMDGYKPNVYFYTYSTGRVQMPFFFSGLLPVVDTDKMKTKKK